jgi:hypothetical protein
MNSVTAAGKRQFLCVTSGLGESQSTVLGGWYQTSLLSVFMTYVPYICDLPSVRLEGN